MCLAIILMNNKLNMVLVKSMLQRIKMEEKLVVEKFLNSLQIYLQHNQIFGFVTFTCTRSNFRSSKLLILYNIILQVLFVSFVSYWLYLVLEADDMLPIYKNTYLIILFADFAYLETTWICTLLKKDKLLELFKRLIHFDTKCQENSTVIDYKRHKKRLLCYLLARYVALALVILFSEILVIVSEQEWSFSTGLLVMIFNSALSYKASEIVVMLRSRFAILNKQIRFLNQYLRLKPEGRISNRRVFISFSKICYLHQHLSKSVKLFNEVFGVSLLVLFGNSFLSIVLALFRTAAELQASQIKWTRIAYMALASVPFIFDSIHLCDVCYSTIGTVSWCELNFDWSSQVSKAGELIHQIQTEDHDIIDEIEMFSLQIANEQVEFNAAGFFPINYTLVFSVRSVQVERI
ncbi:gustatory receptor candidate 3 [Tribolium castaneum]|uniref:Gustatory receptor n=2 Tax=Tribolium castaneum TaxID=7070 RepID=B8PUP9_TRICA|nr:gustatory receptor candidate 3 [Tribolium castaneum]ABY40620.1 gustatory receptor [Tribolium castaneum]|eukprot:NP_001138954.1 gustatory receptor candidate 3 [Tribolium castaneum]